jgi:hypothetical protein
MKTLGGTLGSAVALGAMRPPETVSGPPLRVAESPGSIEIDNGRVKARFSRVTTGIEQEYFGRQADGAWISVAKSFSPPQPRPQWTSPLYGDLNVAKEYRLLAADAFKAVRVVKKTEQEVTVRLSGVLGKNQVEQAVSLSSRRDYFHVEVEAVLEETPPRLEYLLSVFVFTGGAAPDVVHAPHLKRTADNVIGDRSFRAPAAIIQKGTLMAGLVPDLDLLNADVVYAKGARPLVPAGPGTVPQDPAKLSMPTALDIELKSGMTPLPLFSYGFIDYITEQHVYWRHENKNGEMVRELSKNQLHYGFDLFVGADVPPYRGYQRVSRHLWKRFGRKYFARPRPQAMPFDDYAKVCFPAAFEYRGDSAKDTQRYLAWQPYQPDDSGPLPTWVEFEINGKPAGGIRATPTQWYYDIQFMGWWNNVRDAIGMYWWGKRGDPGLIDKARRIINLALAAPQKDGLFPAVYRSNEKRWFGGYWKFPEDFNPHWTFPTKWEPTKHPNYWDFSSDFYQTAAASKTAVYLLRYRRLCEDEPRIVPYVRRYGDFLVNHVDPNGCVPAWFTSDLKPAPELRFNSEGGIHLWFLCELYRATPGSKYLAAAERLANFLIREIFPEQRWYDFETFYSCASKPENFYDPYTGQWPRNTLSMMWAIDGFVALYELTKKREMLDAAERVADYVGLYQAVWQPHFIITAYAFGGQCCQNTDGEWLAMHHTYLAEALVRLARLTHRQDLYERGVAALRASFAIVDHPRLAKNDIFRYPMYPVVEPESIDHEGGPQVNLRSGFDWGEGGGLAAAAELLEQLGGAFVDFKHNTAVGVDGVHVKSFKREGSQVRVDLDNQLAALPFPYDAPYPIRLKITGLPAGEYELILNQKPARKISLPAPAGIRVEIGRDTSK